MFTSSLNNSDDLMYSGRNSYSNNNNYLNINSNDGINNSSNNVNGPTITPLLAPSLNWGTSDISSWNVPPTSPFRPNRQSSLGLDDVINSSSSYDWNPNMYNNTLNTLTATQQQQQQSTQSSIYQPQPSPANPYSQHLEQSPVQHPSKIIQQQHSHAYHQPSNVQTQNPYNNYNTSHQRHGSDLSSIQSDDTAQYQARLQMNNYVLPTNDNQNNVSYNINNQQPQQQQHQHMVNQNQIPHHTPSSSIDSNAANNMYNTNSTAQQSPILQQLAQTNQIRQSPQSQHSHLTTNSNNNNNIQQSHITHPSSNKRRRSNDENKHKPKLNRPQSVDTNNGVITTSTNTTHHNVHTPNSVSSSDSGSHLIDELLNLDQDSDFSMLTDNAISRALYNYLNHRIPDVERSMISKKRMPMVHINIFLAYASSTLQPDEYSKLVESFLSRPQINKVVSSYCEPSTLMKRRFVIDWSRSPDEALGDSSLTPNVAMCIIQTHAMKPTNITKQQSILDTHKPVDNNNNNNNNNQPTTTATTKTTSNNSYTSDNSVVELSNVELSMDTVVSHTNNPVHMEDEDQLQDVVRSSELIEIQRSVMINREFERTFGYSQSSMAELCRKYGPTALYRILSPLPQMTRACEKFLQTKSQQARLQIQEAQNNMTSEVLRIMKLHHLAVSNSSTQFTATVTVNTRYDQSIECAMAARAIYSMDGMIIAWSYIFVPLTS